MMTTDQAKQIVRMLFKNDAGKPFWLTNGQAEIFTAIATRKDKRLHIEAATRYGKSEVISMAVLWRASTFPERWAITAGNKDKAGIIMSDVIKHIYDNDYTRVKFIREKGETDEYIKRYRNKSRINFNIGNGTFGEIFITTAEEALGFGAPNVIEDESALISSKDHALVMRMLGDQPDNFLCKVGNPWEMSHFRKSFEDPEYKKIIIDYRQGLAEGRYTEKYIAEMKKQSFFDVLYECKFPDTGVIDEEGYLPLITRLELKNSYMQLSFFGELKMGIDVAAGGNNFTAITVKGDGYALNVFKQNISDTMAIVSKAKEIATEYKIPFDDRHILIDKTGVGQGLCDRLNELHSGQRFGVVLGSAPYHENGNENLYLNLRAQACWKMCEWVKKGGRIWPEPNFDELMNLRYKIQSDRKIKIKSKDELRRDGIKSPDVADSLMLTFATGEIKKRQVYKQPDYIPMTNWGI